MFIMLLLGCLSGRGYFYRPDVCPSVRPYVCLCVTTVDCGQMAGWIELNFGRDLPLPKRHHVLGGVPSPILGEIRGPKVLGSMGRYRKISSYRHEILYSNYPWPKTRACQISAQSVQKWGSYGPQSLGYVTELIIIASK